MTSTSTTLTRVDTLARRIGRAIAASALATAIVLTIAPGIAQADEFQKMNQWVIEQVKADKVWGKTKGKGVTIAILDDGYLEHPFFEDKDLLPGSYPRIQNDDAYRAAARHGTSSIAAALAIAPEATILPLVIGGQIAPNGMAAVSDESLQLAVRAAVDQGASIISISWIKSGKPNQDLLDALQYAMDNNVIVVAGTGNTPGQEIRYPANIPGVIAVSGSNHSGNLWPSSTTGPETTVAAPADEQMCPIGYQRREFDWEPEPSGPFYEDCRGTSLATPIVSGVLALMLAADAELDANNAINRLIHTASNGINGHNNEMGYGLVNAEAALNATNLPTITENPLGYPLGAPGLSNTTPDTDNESTEEDVAPPTGNIETDSAASTSDSNNLALLIGIAAGLIILTSAILWLLLRNRNKPTAPPAGYPHPGQHPQHEQYGNQTHQNYGQQPPESNEFRR